MNLVATIELDLILPLSYPSFEMEPQLFSISLNSGMWSVQEHVCRLQRLTELSNNVRMDAWSAKGSTLRPC